MITLDKGAFLQKLEDVSPGLSTKEILQQSSCFVFKEGRIITFNEEIACSIKSGLPREFTGAVQSKPLRSILRKITEDEIRLEIAENEIIIHGKRKKAGILLEREIYLPVDTVEQPGEFTTLHPEFNDAITIVQECASKDASKNSLTCLRITPKFIEATDTFQLVRFRLKTGFENTVLLRKEAIKHIPKLDLNKYSITPNWVHFKGAGGLVLSCKSYPDEKFPELSSILESSGMPVGLPKGLAEAINKAEVFSSEDSDNNQILIHLHDNKIVVRGNGISGWFEEFKKVSYSGPSIKFMVSPALLAEIVKRYTDCEINHELHHLIVNGGKFKYVACLETINSQA